MSQFQYQCEDCGADENSRPTDCCDECIVKFYLQNPKAPSIDQYSRWVEYEDEDENDEFESERKFNEE